MRVLITGGAGFIGSHFAERCLRAGWHVTVVDDLSTGCVENIAHLRPHSSFSFKLGTVANASIVNDLVDSVDSVVHLAAAVGVRIVLDRPVHTIETNVQGTEMVLRAAARKKKRVLVASTSEVYGKGTQIPFRESADVVLGATTAARWGYACSKALDEFLALAYWREFRLPVSIVRFFNAAGPRQTHRYGMVLPTFVKQALEERPLTIFGSGEQRRCFADVNDIVEATFRIHQCNQTVGEVINVGNDHEISINDLAKLVLDATGSCSQIRHIPYEEAFGQGFEDMQRRVPCLRKLDQLTGYRPRTGVDEIVRRVVGDHRSNEELSLPVGVGAEH